jgi:hypothetical protein
MRLTDEAVAAASEVLMKGTPTIIGVTTFFGVPWSIWIQSLTVLWLLILITGALWDRFFQSWAGKPLRKWVCAFLVRIFRRV